MRYRYRNKEEMKESGIEWIGNIPKAWDIRQLKRVLIDRRENNNPIKTQNILSLTMEKGVIPYGEKGNGGNKAKEDLSLYKLVYPNDIVLNSMNVVVGSVGLSKYFGCASPAYYMLYKRNENDIIEYFNNIFQSKLFQDSLIGLGNGILVKKSETSGKLNTIRMRIPMEKLNLVKIPVPHSKEQEKIAKFVDEKTAQFDSMISKKQKLIQRLEEAKKSLISEVVTGKVKVVKTSDGYELVERKKDEMKDSGIEWLGYIPKEWSIYRSKYLWKKEKREVKEWYDVITAFRDGEVTLRTNRRTDGFTFSIKEIGYQGVLKGDLVISAMDAFAGAMGISDSEGKCSPVYSVCSPMKELVPEYYKYILKEMSQKGYILSLAKGIRERSTDFRYSEFANTSLLYPDVWEQERIADFLSNNIDKTNYIIEKIKLQILKLKETKQSLISEAVTGKIEILD